MKIILDLRRISAAALFICGVVLYCFLATCHPLLHNHHDDGENHHDCSACNFLAVGSNIVIPQAVIITPILYPIGYQILFNSQQSFLQPFYRSTLTRGPPFLAV
jgi:hypothetical protein